MGGITQIYNSGDYATNSVFCGYKTYTRPSTPTEASSGGVTLPVISVGEVGTAYYYFRYTTSYATRVMLPGGTYIARCVAKQAGDDDSGGVTISGTKLGCYLQGELASGGSAVWGYSGDFISNRAYYVAVIYFRIA